MNKTIIQTIYAQWLNIKGEAQRICEQKSLHNLAEAYRNCSMFKGDETFEELAALYKTPQAVEFCMRYHFPSLATLRTFKHENPERYGIYIDSGTITLNNPKGKIVLAGRTTAVVNCHELRNFNIVCLHSARVVVNASGWAVVRVEAETGCNVVKNTSENAVIL